MLKKLTLVAVAASVVLGSVGVGTAANAAPVASHSVSVKAATVLPAQRIQVYKQHQIDSGKIGLGLGKISKAKGAQRAALQAQNVKAQAASNAWFSKAFYGTASDSQLRALRVKANNEIGKFVSLALQVR